MQSSSPRRFMAVAQEEALEVVMTKSHTCGNVWSRCGSRRWGLNRHGRIGTVRYCWWRSHIDEPEPDVPHHVKWRLSTLISICSQSMGAESVAYIWSKCSCSEVHTCADGELLAELLSKVACTGSLSVSFGGGSGVESFWSPAYDIYKFQKFSCVSQVWRRVQRWGNSVRVAV